MPNPPADGGRAAAGERDEEFEYEVEGEVKKGTRRVLVVDLAAGSP